MTYEFIHTHSKRNENRNTIQHVKKLNRDKTQESDTPSFQLNLTQAAHTKD